MDVELHQAAKNAIQDRFNIVFATNCKKFDLDPYKLQHDLTSFQHHVFSPNDKILLVHMDTDYYDPAVKFGLIPLNVVRIFSNLDIPLHALLFVTNHFGIRKEFDQLLCDQHPADRLIGDECAGQPVARAVPRGHLDRHLRTRTAQLVRWDHAGE